MAFSHPDRQIEIAIEVPDRDLDRDSLRRSSDRTNRVGGKIGGFWNIDLTFEATAS